MPTPVELFHKDYSVEICKDNPTFLFVFGDNSCRYGKGGQAIIRDCPNSFGIATKAHPSSNAQSYFSDNSERNLRVVLTDIYNLTYLINNPNQPYEKVYLPYYGLGTGLADLPSKAPNLYKLILDLVYKINGYPVYHLYEKTSY